MLENFAIFILSHGRPENVITYNTLKKLNYSGKIYILIDDLDKQKDKYIEIFGDKIILFNKEEIGKNFDKGDNFKGKDGVVIFARNACFEIAKKMNIDYFMQLDDDYMRFKFRINGNLEYSDKTFHGNFDDIIISFLNYFKSINAHSLAMSQGGDFPMGSGTDISMLGKHRKCMNSFLCKTNQSFNFIGRINEDVNTYCKLGSMGYLFLTFPHFSLVQKETQQNSGGMTDIYLESGTYIKSFYTIIYHPSSVKILSSWSTGHRLHHSIQWKNTVPMIIEEKYKTTSNKL